MIDWSYILHVFFFVNNPYRIHRKITLIKGLSNNIVGYSQFSYLTYFILFYLTRSWGVITTPREVFKNVKKIMFKNKCPANKPTAVEDAKSSENMPEICKVFLNKIIHRKWFSFSVDAAAYIRRRIGWRKFQNLFKGIVAQNYNSLCYGKIGLN